MDWLWSLINRLWGVIEHISQENLHLTEANQHLRDEIAVLEGEKPKPNVKPGGMEQGTEPKPAADETSAANGDKPSKRPGSAKAPRPPTAYER